jgi:very-short-patch-repair endonuclease
MSAALPLPRRASSLIEQQSGVVTTHQLAGLGLTPRMIERRARSWTRLQRGLHLTREATWHSAVWAGLLQGGASSVVGAGAAVFLYDVLRDEPQQVTIWSPARLQDLEVGSWAVEFRRGLRTGRGNPVRTTLEAGLLDLARTSDELEVVSAVTRALALGRTTPSRLLAELGRRQRLRHGAVIRELCEKSSRGLESALEWLFTRDVLRAHRLPEPQRQVRTHEGRVDLVYDCGLFIELDGMRDHSDWSKDMMRDNQHAVRLGAVTLRYGFNAAMTQACAAASQVREALRIRRVATDFRRCRLCPDP